MSAKPRGKFWLQTKSKKLAVLLITVLTVSSTLGMLVPRNKIFSSWWFLLICFMFFINLSACTIDQIIRARNLWRHRKSAPAMENCHTDVAYLKTTRENFEKAFSQHGFKSINKNNDSVVFIKGSGAIWSPVIIHLGLVMIVIGGLISTGFKMSGYMTVMEGEIRKETAAQYEVLSKSPLFDIIGHTGYGIGLLKQQRVLKKNGQVDYLISDITLLEGDKEVLRKPVEEGKPLTYKGLSLNEYNAGFAPFVVITGSGGRQIYNGFLFMDSVEGGTNTPYQRNNFTVPGTSLSLDIRFYPDMLMKGRELTNRKLALGNPGMEITVTKAGQKPIKGVILKGEKLNFAGNSLSFADVKQWTGLEIIYDPGANILFAGCWITVAGLLLLYTLNYRKLLVKFEPLPDGVKIKVSFYSLKYRDIFKEEIRALILNLGGVVQ